MDIRIEDARPEHIEEIQDVFYKAWLQTYPNEEAGITVDDIEDRWRDRHSPEKLAKHRENLHTLAENIKYIVALDGTKVVGVARAVKDEKENRLNAIYVLPEYQGKGAGGKLWTEIKKFLDPSRDIVVGVATYNEKAIEFYKKLGFEDTGRRYTEERLRLKSGAIFPEMDMAIKAL